MSSLSRAGESDNIDRYDPLETFHKALYEIKLRVAKTHCYEDARKELCSIYRRLALECDRTEFYKTSIQNFMVIVYKRILGYFHEQRRFEIRPIIILIGIFRRRTRYVARRHFWRPLFNIKTPPPVVLPPTQTGNYVMALLSIPGLQILSSHVEKKLSPEALLEFVEYPLGLPKTRLKRAAIILIGLKRRGPGRVPKLDNVDKLFIRWFAQSLVLFRVNPPKISDLRVGY